MWCVKPHPLSDFDQTLVHKISETNPLTNVEMYLYSSVMVQKDEIETNFCQLRKVHVWISVS